MNLNISAAEEALKHPSQTLDSLLSDASPDAQAAINEARASLASPSHTSNGQQRGEGGQNRIQIVDEDKKFR
jgi:hypothetical protein